MRERLHSKAPRPVIRMLSSFSQYCGAGGERVDRDGYCADCRGPLNTDCTGA